MKKILLAVSFLWMATGAIAGQLLNPYPSNLPNGSDMPVASPIRRNFKKSLLNTNGNVVPTVRLAYIIPSNRTPQPLVLSIRSRHRPV